MKNRLAIICVLSVSFSAMAFNTELTAEQQQLVVTGCEVAESGPRLERLEAIANTMIALQQLNQELITQRSDMNNDQKRRVDITTSDNDSKWNKCMAMYVGALNE